LLKKIKFPFIDLKSAHPFLPSQTINSYSLKLHPRVITSVYFISINFNKNFIVFHFLNYNFINLSEKVRKCFWFQASTLIMDVIRFPPSFFKLTNFYEIIPIMVTAKIKFTYLGMYKQARRGIKFVYFNLIQYMV